MRGVEKTFPGGIVAARGVDLSVEDGELFVIVGPSASGKSTLLRLVAGLESTDGGSILLDGRRIDGLAPRDRDVAMVFQDQVVYPHLNVFENIAFGLRARGVSRDEIVGRVEGTSSVLGVAECLQRPPSTLSGGQRRRVALGRGMVLRPKLFLLDEPFAGLDAPLRASTRAELVDLRRKLGATMILVTHDQGEALALGDRIAVLDQGRVVQVASPLELYDRPADRFVARFIGQPGMNLLPCLLAREGPTLSIRLLWLESREPWSVPLRNSWASRLAGLRVPRVDLGLRPEQIGLTVLAPDSTFDTSLPSTVERLEPMGHETLAYLKVGSHELAVRLPARTTIRVGDRVGMRLDLDKATWFDSSTGHRID